MDEGLRIGTRAGRARAVARRLSWGAGLRYAGSDGDRHIRALWSGGRIESLSEALRALDADIVSVEPDPDAADAGPTP